MQSYSRRELKKEDKFAETAQGAFEWAGEHRSTLIWVIAAVVVVAAAVVGLWLWNSHQNDQANIELGKATRTLAAPLRPAGTPETPGSPSFTTLADRNKAAAKEFNSVADTFPHTKAGKLARYMAAAALAEIGDSSAEKLLKDVADSGDANLSAMAKLVLANFYRSSNRQADAVKIYKDLIDHSTESVPKSRAQLELAGMYEATDPHEATALYQQIEKEEPASIAGQIAASKLAAATTDNK